jgi:hypothetical protein
MRVDFCRNAFHASALAAGSVSMRFPTPALVPLLVVALAAPGTAASLSDLGFLADTLPTVALNAAAPDAQASSASPQANGGQNENGPTTEAVTIQMNLTGVATRTDGGPDDGFVAYINITGSGTRRTPNGNGVQIRGDDLAAEVKVVRTADNVTVAQYVALVDFHAQEASSIAQGLDAGNFRFNLGLHGKRSESVVSIEEGDRIMAMNSHGFTTGPADDDGFHAVQGDGQTTLKNGEQSATHYNIALGGTAGILSA